MQNRKQTFIYLGENISLFKSKNKFLKKYMSKEKINFIDV